MTTYDKKTLEQLWDGKLRPEELRHIQSQFKDTDRFRKFLGYCQERVEWDDRIILPLQPHLFIVQKPDGRRIIKCDCGHEFGDYRENWKLQAQVFVRDTEESLQEVYPPMMHSDPEWMVLREFYCPGCASLLEVEAVPPGYPIIQDFQPDLETLYKEWLGEDLPNP
jgi:acetone carboxylase gamma subunit